MMISDDGIEKDLLPEGIYETLINNDTQAKIEEIEHKTVLKVEKADLKDHSAPSRLLAYYVKELVQDNLEHKELNDQVNTVNHIISGLDDESRMIPDGTWLKSIQQKERFLPRPSHSIAFTSVFTGENNSIASELKKEILSSDRIDLLVSFIKWSGLKKLRDQLREVSKRNPKVQIRVITTCYMGVTEANAVERLRKECGAEIKINYDTTGARLHAKAYIFHRNSGFDTAYVGSSNMSEAALSSGMEWNVKLAKHETPETVKEIEDKFEDYWYQENKFIPYLEGDYEKLAEILKQHKRPTGDTSIETTYKPYDYQQEILDALQNDRDSGFNRNLVIAATGTGKTMIAAFDYKNWREQRKAENKSTKILFIAHREEILEQSLSAFRKVLGKPNFGDMLTGNTKPSKDFDYNHLFCSIQSFNSRKLWERNDGDETFYDYIVVDEFHHAAAASYQKLLSFYKPSVLLGLTATPERMDGKDIRTYFDGRYSFELRLPEAIGLGLLCHFDYFGITDTADLSLVKWVNGSYDVNDLTDCYTLESHNAGERANLILNSTLDYVDDIEKVKGLGFCVSKKHAFYMADYFNKQGIESIALTSESTEEERTKARKALKDDKGTLKFIFTVDLYNEGVDIPAVNTVLFLRPTQSLTVFLQQLGRGLRLYKDKRLTVLDFIAQANEKYSFAERFQALLPRSKDNVDVKKQVENFFPNLPAGCTIQLEKMAEKYILKNISENIETANNLLKRFQMMTGLEPTLTNFFSAYPDMKKEIYKSKTFTTALKKAGLTDIKTDKDFEENFKTGIYRMSNINSRKWISFLKDAINSNKHDWNEEEKTMLRMLNATFMTSGVPYEAPLEYGLDLIKSHDYLRDEMEDLMTYNYAMAAEQRDNVLPYPSNLEIYSEYTRDQIFLAFGYKSSPYSFQSGVKYFEEYNTDVFLVTLNKPENTKLSLKYKDYGIDSHYFHWQSRSDTTPKCKTGKRYIAKTSTVLFFVRNDKQDTESGQAELYTFLGPATFIESSGSAPMNIKWRLKYAIPNKFLRQNDSIQII